MTTEINESSQLKVYFNMFTRVLKLFSSMFEVCLKYVCMFEVCFSNVFTYFHVFSRVSHVFSRAVFRQTERLIECR